jgi:hypothetical protein
VNLTKNKKLREKILERIKELDYSQSFIIKDAEERNMVIKPERLSRYLNNKNGGLTEDQLLWVSTRLGIFININFGNLIVDEGKAMFVIPKYNEIEILKRIRLIFPPKNNG